MKTKFLLTSANPSNRSLRLQYTRVEQHTDEFQNSEMPLKFCKALFIQLCIIKFVLFVAYAGPRFKYTVHDCRKCDSDDNAFLTFRNIPIQKCLFECRVRLRCNAVKFMTIRRECVLLETYMYPNMASRCRLDNPERRNWPRSHDHQLCIFIRMTDVVDVSPIPDICQNCSAEQVCNIQTESCDRETVCEDNWIKIKQSCYFFLLTQKHFAEAQEYCTSRGAHLVHFETEAENMAVNKYIDNNLEDHSVEDHFGWWIGLTDEETEGEWKLTQTNSVAKFVNWNDGEPNNLKGQEHCAAMVLRYGKRWNDVLCNWGPSGFPTICEKW